VLVLTLSACTSGDPESGGVPTFLPPSPPASPPAVITVTTPSVEATASDGYSVNLRPLPDVDPTTVTDQLSTRWGLNPSRTGHDTRTDQATGTLLEARTLSNGKHDMRVLSCAATLTTLGTQYLDACISMAIPGTDQNAALSWLNTELTSKTPPPSGGHGDAHQSIGTYHLAMISNTKGYTIAISAQGS
jgi:hypothetical protein